MTSAFSKLLVTLQMIRAWQAVVSGYLQTTWGVMICQRPTGRTNLHTISSSEGVMRPDRPMMSALCSTAASRIFSHGVITPRSMICIQAHLSKADPLPPPLCSATLFKSNSTARFPSSPEIDKEQIAGANQSSGYEALQSNEHDYARTRCAREYARFDSCQWQLERTLAAP